MKANNVLHRGTRERHIAVASLRLIFSLFMTLIALAVDLMATMMSAHDETAHKRAESEGGFGFEDGWACGSQGYGNYRAGVFLDGDNETDAG